MTNVNVMFDFDRFNAGIQIATISSVGNFDKSLFFSLSFIVRVFRHFSFASPPYFKFNSTLKNREIGGNTSKSAKITS